MAVFDRIALIERYAGIQHRTARAGKKRNIAEAGVDPIAERPFDRLPIVNIDVVIDDDDVLGRVMPEMAAPECCGDLLRMTAVRFADLHAHGLRPFATPHAGDIRHPRLLEVMPGHCREGRRRPGCAFVGSSGTRPRQATMENRIGAMRDALDPNGVFRRFASAIITRVLAERPFERVSRRVSRDKPFEHDFGACWNQKIAKFALHQLHGCPPERSRHVILRIIDRS